MTKTPRASSPRHDVRNEPFRMLLIRKWPSDLVKKAPSVIKAYRKYARLLQATRKNATATGPAAKRRELALGRSAHRVVEELFAFRCSLTKQTRQITNAQDSIEEGYINNMSAGEINSVLTSNFALEFLRSPGVKEAIGSLYWILLEPPPRLVIVPLSVRIEEEDDYVDESGEENKSPKSPRQSLGISLPSTPKSPQQSPRPSPTQQNPTRQVDKSQEKTVKWIDQLFTPKIQPPASKSSAPTHLRLEPKPTPAESARKELGWWQMPRSSKDTTPQNTHNASVHELLVRRVVAQEKLDAIVRERRALKREEDFKVCMERNPFASIQKPLSWQKKYMKIPKSPRRAKDMPAKCHYCRKQDALDPQWVFWLRPAGIPPLCQFCERRRLRGEFFEAPQKRPQSSSTGDTPGSPMDVDEPEVQTPRGLQNLWDTWGPWGAWSPWRLQQAEKPKMRADPMRPRWTGFKVLGKRPGIQGLEDPNPKRSKKTKTNQSRPVEEGTSGLKAQPIVNPEDVPLPTTPEPESPDSVDFPIPETFEIPEPPNPQDVPLPATEPGSPESVNFPLPETVEIPESPTPQMPGAFSPRNVPLPTTEPGSPDSVDFPLSETIEIPESPNPQIIPLPETATEPNSPWDPENLQLSSEQTGPEILKLKIPVAIQPPNILPISPSEIPLPKTPDIIELEIPLPKTPDIELQIPFCQTPEQIEPEHPKAARTPGNLKGRKKPESRVFKPVTPPHHRIAKKRLPKPQIVQTSLANMLRMTMASFIASTRRSAAGRKSCQRRVHSERSLHHAAKIRRLRGRGHVLNDPRRFYGHYS